MLDTELFPAQILYLRAPKKVSIQDVLSVILKDLTVRRILKVLKLNSYPNTRSKKPQKYSMIFPGPDFQGYEPQYFEKSIIAPLSEIGQVQTKILTNFVLKKYSYPSAFIGDQFFKPLKKEGYMSAIPLLSGMGFIKPSNKAKEIVQQVNTFLASQQEKIANLLNGDAQEFIEAIEETGSYLFLLESQAPELFEDLAKKIKNIAKSYGKSDFNLTPFVEALNLDLSYLHE